MAQISITIPNTKVTEIANMAKAEGLTSDKSDLEIVTEIVKSQLKAHYRSAKQRELNNTPIQELNI